MDNNENKNTGSAAIVKKKKTGKEIAGLILNIAIWVFVLFAITITVIIFASLGSEDGIPSFGKTMWISIQSDSMEKTINTGDLVFASKLTDTEKDALAVGDIITYRVDLNGDGTEELNTHRITRLLENGKFKTQGDNKTTNPTEDNYEVAKSAVVAKYNGGRIGGLGAVIDFLNTQIGFGIFVVLPIIALFVYYLINFINLIKPKKAVTADQEAEIKRLAIEEYLRQQKEEAAKAAETEKDSEAVPAAKASDTENKQE